MVSQVQGFVHLLAMSNGSQHEAQLFRMRWDQPLRRFAKAYAAFRELSPAQEASLKMSTPAHGELDQNATASVYGLADGDQVFFVTEPAAVLQGLSEANPGAAAGVPDKAETTSAATTPLPRSRQARIPEEARSAEKQPPPAAATGCAAPGGDIVVKKQAEEPRFRCPVASCKQRQAREFGFTSEADYKRHMRVRHPKAKVTQQLELSQRDQRARSARLAAASQGMARGRARGTAGAAGGRSARAKAAGRGGRGAKSGADETALGEAAPAGLPGVPRGLTRSVKVGMGPARGWRVTSWLKDVSGRQSVAHDRAVCWRIMSPAPECRIYKTFRALEGAVSEGVYTQIYTAVRPELLRKITDRRKTLEAPARSKLKRLLDALPAPGPSTVAVPAPAAASPAPLVASEPPRKQQKRLVTFVEEPGAKRLAPAALKRAATRIELPVPKVSESILATQPFAALKEPPHRSGTGSWVCSCDAHMRRHPRCIYAGHQQPLLVHLRDRMLIGRGETCDVVLDSRRTPQMISRSHVVLSREDGLFTLTDQGSLNGVLVNGERVRGKQALAHGDVITFGVPTPTPEFDYVFECRPSEDVAPSRNELALVPH